MLLFGDGEFQCAPFDLRVVQPRPVEHPTFDVSQLALNSPLEADAARAGELAVEAFEADPVNRVALDAPKVVGAELRAVETVTTAWFAFPRERIALWRDQPPGHERGVPSR